MGTIVAGIISGLLTVILVFSLSGLFSRLLLPWYRNLVYDGVRVDRSWVTSHVSPSGNVHEMKMNLSQRAGTVDGDVQIAKKIGSSDKVEHKSYKLTGVIRDRFLILNARNAKKGEIGIYTELLEAVGDGRQLQGITIWYSITKHEIDSVRVAWHAE